MLYLGPNSWLLISRGSFPESFSASHFLFQDYHTASSYLSFPSAETKPKGRLRKEPIFIRSLRNKDTRKDEELCNRTTFLFGGTLFARGYYKYQQ